MPLAPQTCMNKNSRSTSGVASSKSSNRSPFVTEKTRLPAHRECSREHRPSLPPRAGFGPARGLMICLGWLRLFQAIISETYIPPTRKPSAH